MHVVNLLTWLIPICNVASLLTDRLFCCQAVGMLYLHEVLKPIINRIFDEKKYIELDPCKIDLNRTRCN